MKILLYGAGNRDLRNKVISYLGDSHSITGVSDSFFTSDTLQYERFIPPADINKSDFDQILILIRDEKKREQVREELQSVYGIDPGKITDPLLLLQEGADFIPDLKEELVSNGSEGNDTIIMGLSYSMRGIDFDRFKYKCLDFSWHGLDLYYNYLMLTAIIDERPEIFRSIKQILLVIPFYYFNYDMSLSPYQFYTGQILALHGFHDWHNAQRSESRIIRDYGTCDELFGERFWTNRRWKKREGVFPGQLDAEGIKLPGLWKNDHKETIDENVEIYERILSRAGDKDIKVIIPPIYVKDLDQEDKEIYCRRKEDFFYCIKRAGGTIPVIDLSERLKEIRFFANQDHVNEEGRKCFTAMLNEEL